LIKIVGEEELVPSARKQFVRRCQLIPYDAFISSVESRDFMRDLIFFLPISSWRVDEIHLLRGSGMPQRKRHCLLYISKMDCESLDST